VVVPTYLNGGQAVRRPEETKLKREEARMKLQPVKV